jgi:High-temperature-induced dauer-formation protein
VWEVISPVTVRRLREEKPQNVELLFRSAVAHIQKVIAAPSPASLEQTLTCVRVLTRTLPFLLVSLLLHIAHKRYTLCSTTIECTMQFQSVNSRNYNVQFITHKRRVAQYHVVKHSVSSTVILIAGLHTALTFVHAGELQRSRHRLC